MSRKSFSMLLALVSLALAGSLFAQSPPPSDPQALAFAAQSITALSGGAAISDVTLTGSATWIAGSDSETGTATLMAKGTGESRIDLNLSGGVRTDIRNDTLGYPQGASAVSGGALQPWAFHNCWINSSWFFPELSFLSTTTDPTLVFSYVGPETRAGASVQHLRVYRYLTGQAQATISLTQQVSTAEFYLDSTSLLPVALTFNTHPDDDANTNISLEIDFSNYQPVNGIQVPFRIKKLISGGLAVDMVVQSAVLNSGLSDGLFAVQ